MSAPCCTNPACCKVRKRRADGFLEGARDLCRACYERAWAAGFPPVVPPPMPRSQRGASARRRATAGREARIARVASLTDRGYPVAVAARMAGVRPGTASKYLTELRGRQQRTDVAA